jgi:hypothetical protein
MTPLSRAIRQQIQAGSYTEVREQIYTQKEQVNGLCFAIFSKSNRCINEFISEMPWHLFSHVDSEYGQSPLQIAITLENIDAVRLMLRKGADVKTKCCQGFDALDYAKKTNNPEIIALIKENSTSWFCCV